MKKESIVIISAKFAVGHYSHLKAYYFMCQEAGYDPILAIDWNYIPYMDCETKYILIEKIKEYKFDYFVIYNMSIKDNYLVKILKRNNKNIKGALVYHEPWRGYIAEFKRELKLKIYLKIVGRHICSIFLLKKMDVIILCSENGKYHYSKHDIKYNSQYAVFPLIFCDETDTYNFPDGDRKYFSFISTVDPSKLFNKFLEFMIESSSKYPEFLYQIATRSDISDYLQDDRIKKLLESKRLLVKHARDLSNEEINCAYAQSACTWLMYGASTQSGVLGKSFMYGAPCIARKVGAFEEYVNEKNGKLLDECDMDLLEMAYQEILSELEVYSENARETFEKKYLYKNRINDWKKLMELIKNKK